MTAAGGAGGDAGVVHGAADEHGRTVTVLLARQRSGTNALRSVLTTHPEIHCFDEVFKFEARLSPDPFVRASNYFTFLEQYCAGDIRRAFPDQQDALLDAYVAYLRGLTPKPRILLDVKYNSTHHLAGPWREIAEPTLFPMLRARQIGVLHLTRGNLLRCLVSSLKAWRSRLFIVRQGAPPPDGRLSLPPTWVLQRLETWAEEDRRVAAAFDGYARYKRVEYADLFPDTSGVVPPEALRDIAEWLGVAPRFAPRPSIAKQSSLPLSETLENFDEIRVVLAGTRFGYCLDDEPAYRDAPPVSAVAS